MRKIPTLFVRNPDDRRFVIDQVAPACEWVLAGEGRATRKYDGANFMLDEQGVWWARREVKKDAVPPPGWFELEHDHVTGKSVGYEPVDNSSFIMYFQQALAELHGALPGTYELIGPKINRNPERAEGHTLVAHDAAEVLDAPRDFAGLGPWLRTRPYEGIVWHHDDGSGRMVKIKRRDFAAVLPPAP